MANWRISKQIYISMGCILALLAVLVIISLFATSRLSTAFTDYRGSARQTQLTGFLIEDLLEARLAVFGYRLEASADKAEIVDDRVAEIIAGRSKADALFEGDKDALAVLDDVAISIKAYQAAFEEMGVLQSERETLVAEMSQLGPQARKRLTSIMTTAFRDGDSVAAFYAGKVQEDLMLGRFYSERFLLSNDGDAAVLSHTHLAEALKTARILLTELQNPDRYALAQGAISDMNAYDAVLTQVTSVIAQRNALRSDRLDVLGPAMQSKYKAIFDAVVARQDEIGPRGASTAKLSLTLVLVIGLLALAAGFVLARVIGRQISAQVVDMADVMSQVARGDLEKEITGADRENELGDMARALTVFKQTGLEAQRLAQETEAARVQKEHDDAARAAEDAEAQALKEAAMQAELDRQNHVKKRVEAFTQGVGEVIEQVAAGAQKLNESAGQMSDIAQSTQQQSSSVASASEQATNNVSSVASAAEELSASLKEVTARVMDASNLARDASKDAARTNNIVDGLNNAVKEISSVTALIQDIAEQTNLLALNATIEAARAGDAGKGFSVVASEVKMLASQTGKATEDISTQIARMQDVTRSAVEAINSVNSSVQRIDESAGAVAAAAEEQTAVTSEISANVQQAAAGTRDVTDNIVAVSERATQTGSIADVVRDASDQLNSDAKRLNDLVASFVDDVQAA